MYSRFFPTLSLICCIILPFAAAAVDYNYVNPALIPPQVNSPPPVEKSAAWENEIDIIMKLQRTSSKLDIQAANDETHLTPDLMDKTIGRDHFPKTYVLLDKVNTDCENIVHNAKNYWHTTRPYLADKRVELLIPPINSPAYPSGHTACSKVFAEVLSQLSPTKSEYYRARADDIAGHRIYAGVHWPSDISAGRQIGLIIFGALQMSDSYQHDLKTAKSEWGK